MCGWNVLHSICYVAIVEPCKQHVPELLLKTQPHVRVQLLRKGGSIGDALYAPIVVADGATQFNIFESSSCVVVVHKIYSAMFTMPPGIIGSVPNTR
jgi:hypothetical protein